MRKLKFLLGLWAGKLVVLLTNIINKEKGTNIPGVVAMKFSKDFISNFKGVDYDKMLFITGTNGKSTTNNMIIHALKTAGKTVTTNLSGANLITGVATAMLKNSSLTGKMKTEFFIFETDERYLAMIHKYLPSKNLCVTNIQKDQVQRNGEPDFIYKKIQKVISDDMTIFVNNDEPRCKSFEQFTDKVVYYGVDRSDSSFVKDGIYDVTMPCPMCGNRLTFAYYNIDNVGSYSCETCGFANEKDIRYIVKDIDLERGSVTLGGDTYHIKYTQPFFLYNYSLCLAVCDRFGIPKDKVKESFKTFRNIGGRLETIKYGSKEIKYIRMKQENPETLQSAFDYIANDTSEKIFMLGLEQLEDFKPYYTNTFYAFDCNVQKLIDSNVKRCICFSEAVAYDSANRLIYAGFDRDKISILPTDSDEALFAELDKVDCDNIYLITWLHKYEELISDIAKIKKED